MKDSKEVLGLYQACSGVLASTALLRELIQSYLHITGQVEDWEMGPGTAVFGIVVGEGL